MKDEIRIRLSVGLIVVAIVHAALLGAVFTVLHQTPPPCTEDCWQLPPSKPTTPVGRQIERLTEPATVNLEAQGELKQQSGYCPPCPPNARPLIRPYRVGPTTPVVPATPSIPSPRVPAPTAPAPIIVTPASTGSPSSTTPEPAKKRYQIALFVGNDAKSSQIVDWFDKDPDLAKLKSKCAFQVYTETNAIYRTRFADIVPAGQFPVVLFQDASGGHVHAAGHTMTVCRCPPWNTTWPTAATFRVNNAATTATFIWLEKCRRRVMRDVSTRTGRIESGRDGSRCLVASRC